MAEEDGNVEGYSYQISRDSAVLTLYISDDCEFSEKKTDRELFPEIGEYSQYGYQYWRRRSQRKERKFLTPMGNQIPLSDIVRIEYRDAPITLTRVDGIYQVVITATIPLYVDTVNRLKEEIFLWCLWR